MKMLCYEDVIFYISKSKHYLKDLLISQYNIDPICSTQFISWLLLTSQNIRKVFATIVILIF